MPFISRTGLVSVQRGQVIEPEVLGGAGPRDDAGVPDTVQVGAPVEEPDLGLIPALVVVLADVQGWWRSSMQWTRNRRANRRSSTDLLLSFTTSLNSLILSTTQPFVETSPEKRESYLGSSKGTSTSVPRCSLW